MNPSFAIVADYREIPDHAEAFAGILEKAAREIRLNRSAEDVANELLPIVRVATRRT